jgi:hypothetical protein
VTPGRESAEDGAQAAAGPASQLSELRARRRGEAIVLANEFAEVVVSKVETRNGARLLIESPKSGQWVSLCPLELEALTWQGAETFSAMIGSPFASLIGPEGCPPEPEDEP